MKSSKIDVPVLLIFFARPSTFREVFDSVRQARPGTLLLWQDGPRNNNNNDIEGIAECRRIIDEGLDWDCVVYKQYNESNYGCDPSTFYAHKWAFSLVEKCIILEDDQVPSQSYYHFCKDLLDFYEFDERISHICGINPIENNDKCPADYFFAYNGTGAWASWRRVARQWDETYSFMEKSYYLHNLKFSRGELFRLSYANAKTHQKTGKEFWETILGFSCMMNNQLVILPKMNLVRQMGVIEGATHGSDMRLLSSSIRKIFLLETFDIEFPLTHQEYVIPDADYVKKYNEIMGIGHPFVRICRKIDYLFRCIRYGYLGELLKRKLGR